MGLRGPAPTPTKVLQLRGTFRKDRHGDPSSEPEFTPVTKLPPAPKYLDKVGKSEWKRAGRELIDKGLLSAADLAAFAAYCAHVSRAVKAELAMLDGPLVVHTPQGSFARPEINIAKTAWFEALKFCREFGLTPSARTRVRGQATSAPAAEAPADPWAEVGS